MGDEDLLDELADLARQERSAACRDAQDAFRPLDERARERLTDTILASLSPSHEDSAPPASRTRPLRARHGGAPQEAAGEDPRAASPEADSLGGTSVAPDLVVPPEWARDDEDEQPASGPRSSIDGPIPGPRAKPGALRRDDSGRAADGPPRRSRARAVATAAAWALAALLLSFLALRPAPFAQSDAPVAIPFAARASLVTARAAGDADRGWRVVVVIGPDPAQR